MEFDTRAITFTPTNYDLYAGNKVTAVENTKSVAYTKTGETKPNEAFMSNEFDKQHDDGFSL